MAEVLARFVEHVVDDDGIRYKAQACAAAMADHRWEAWIEFMSVEGGRPVRTPRETTQPTRQDAEHWAAGLTQTYLEGALERALRKRSVVSPPPAEPVFEAPAPDLVTFETPPGHAVDAILNPFAVYQKGEGLLRQQLGALAERHLVNIILAYDLEGEPVEALSTRSKSALIETIVRAVRQS